MSQFPEHYNSYQTLGSNHNFKVYTNPSGELFVENTKTNECIRLSSINKEGIVISISCGNIKPVIQNHMICYQVLTLRH